MNPAAAARSLVLSAFFGFLALGTHCIAHETDGKAPLASHILKITGQVKKPVQYSVKDLKTLPSVSLKELMIVSKKGARALKELKGVSVKTLIDRAEIISKTSGDSKKVLLVATATDGYQALFSWNEVFNSPLGEGVLVIYEQGGRPVPDSEGEFLLVSAKDYMTGSRHVKWLTSIDVRKIND
ncbi:MAG TPA: molybdopterin-dependent oxidoreductase [Bdellovibrionales bacterium]|nr:molybdopterin-dependent oxidoreductase [Bdellovibrionales bacterium]